MYIIFSEKFYPVVLEMLHVIVKYWQKVGFG